MAYGYNNKVLFVNLTTGEMTTEEIGERLMRMYMGGDGLGTYYAMRDIPANCDPMGPDNRLIIGTGIATGAPVAATSRVTCNFKSPVTGGIGASEAGGAFGTRMKYSGFDMLVITGKADKPVYLYLDGGKAEIRDASHLWGKTNKEYTEILTEELGKAACPFGIGPAGENLNLYAAISTGLSHFCGRTGTGAVMGSKNLKCVVAMSTKPMYEYFDAEKLKAYNKQAIEKGKAGEYEWWRTQGTSGCPVGFSEAGNFPTKNYTEGTFAEATSLETNAWIEKGIYGGNHACHNCGIACKQRMKANKAEHGYDVDPAYGGPEYETDGAFGSNLMIGNPVVVGKANEICNAYGIDTISFGSMVALVMHCYEKGLITTEQCYGVEPKWGSAELLLTLLEKATFRAEGLGNAMANGLDATAAWIGNGADKLAFSTKNNAPAMHAPQVRQNLALNYAVHEYGDHQTVQIDHHLAEGKFEGNPSAYYQKGIYSPCVYGTLGEDKARANYYTHIQFSITNILGVCDFGWNSDTAYDLTDTVEIVKAITGWNTNLWEIMKSTERYLILSRLFNQREGFGVKDDELPERMFGNPYTEGPMAGSSISREQFLRARELYYDMAGLDSEGHPRYSKALELDLLWAKKLVDEAKA